MVFQVKVNISKLSDADDFGTWSHLKPKSENDCCSVWSWLRSELELNIFIDKLQNCGLSKEKKQKNNNDFFAPLNLEVSTLTWKISLTFY